MGPNNEILDFESACSVNARAMDRATRAIPERSGSRRSKATGINRLSLRKAHIHAWRMNLRDATMIAKALKLSVCGELSILGFSVMMLFLCNGHPSAR